MVLINTSLKVFHVMSDSLGEKYGVIVREANSKGSYSYSFFPYGSIGVYQAEHTTIRGALEKAGLDRKDIESAYIIRSQAKITVDNWDKEW